MNMENKIYAERKVSDYKELLEKCASEYKDKNAFSFKKNNNIINKTYIEFKEEVEALGTLLIDKGYEKAKIGIIANDRYEWCLSYLAITTTNNIVVPLDHGLTEKEIINLIDRSEISCIFYDEKFEKTIKELNYSKDSKLKEIICFDENFDNYIEKGIDLIKKDNNNEYSKIKINKDDMSILIFTSGTTSDSKAVMLSQNNICSNISAMTTLIKSRENDNILVFLPLHHTLACTASFLFCFYAGFKICFADSIKSIPKNLKEYEIRGLVCVPAVLELMYKTAIKGIKKQNKYTMFKIMSFISNFLYKIGVDVRRKLFKDILEGFGGYLRIIIYGSASTKKEIVKFYTTIGIDMMQGYGLTETSPVIACESDKNHNNYTSTGYPLYNEEVRIENKDEQGIGEIIIKGPNVMLGYYENEEATKSSIQDGWFHTGDLGYFDKDGKLYVTGRKKDIIVLKNGKKVNPEELEKLLEESDMIDESFVYGSPQDNGDYKISAKLVYSKDNDQLKNKSDEEIYEILDEEVKKTNKLMPIYKYIKNITVTKEKLIRTTTNKIKRFEELKKINKK